MTQKILSCCRIHNTESLLGTLNLIMHTTDCRWLSSRLPGFASITCNLRGSYGSSQTDKWTAFVVLPKLSGIIAPHTKLHIALSDSASPSMPFCSPGHLLCYICVSSGHKDVPPRLATAAIW